jgi:hypothetical protein
MSSVIKNNYKFILGVLILILIPIIIPMFNLIVEIIFSLGSYTGTIARKIIENIPC